MLSGAEHPWLRFHREPRRARDRGGAGPRVPRNVYAPRSVSCRARLNGEFDIGGTRRAADAGGRADGSWRPHRADGTARRTHVRGSCRCNSTIGSSGSCTARQQSDDGRVAVDGELVEPLPRRGAFTRASMRRTCGRAFPMWTFAPGAASNSTGNRVSCSKGPNRNSTCDDHAERIAAGGGCGQRGCDRRESCGKRARACGCRPTSKSC